MGSYFGLRDTYREIENGIPDVEWLELGVRGIYVVLRYHLRKGLLRCPVGVAQQEQVSFYIVRSYFISVMSRRTAPLSMSQPWLSHFHPHSTSPLIDHNFPHILSFASQPHSPLSSPSHYLGHSAQGPLGSAVDPS
jgi:hypothetical protein